VGFGAHPDEGAEHDLTGTWRQQVEEQPGAGPITQLRAHHGPVRHGQHPLGVHGQVVEVADDPS